MILTKQEFPIWMSIAKKYLGVKEIPGPPNHPTILRMLRSTNIGSPYNETELTPWCSASVNLIITEARDLDSRIDRPTNSAAASSWRKWGRGIEYGQYGCIVVMTRPGGNHVGFYYDEDWDDGVRIIGGNQGNMQCIRRFPWDVITDFRWPKGYPLKEEA